MTTSPVSGVVRSCLALLEEDALRVFGAVAELETGLECPVSAGDLKGLLTRLPPPSTVPSSDSWSSSLKKNTPPLALSSPLLLQLFNHSILQLISSHSRIKMKIKLDLPEKPFGRHLQSVEITVPLPLPRQRAENTHILHKLFTDVPNSLANILQRRTRRIGMKERSHMLRKNHYSIWG